MDFTKREKFDPELHDFVPLPNWAIGLGFGLAAVGFFVAVVMV